MSIIFNKFKRDLSSELPKIAVSILIISMGIGGFITFFQVSDNIKTTVDSQYDELNLGDSWIYLQPIPFPTPEEIAETPDVEHPLIRVHDETGNKAIYFNSNRTDRIVGLERKEKEDFGQTLGVMGVGEGCYIVLPVLGPSTIRDTAGSFINVMGGDPYYNISAHGNNEYLDKSDYMLTKTLTGIDLSLIHI